MIRWVRLHSPSAEGHDLTLIRKLDLTCNKIPCVQAKIQPATNKTWHRQLYTYICFLKHKFRRICITFSNQNLSKTFFVAIAKIILKFICKGKGTRISKTWGKRGSNQSVYVISRLITWLQQQRQSGSHRESRTQQNPEPTTHATGFWQSCESSLMEER